MHVLCVFVMPDCHIKRAADGRQRICVDVPELLFKHVDVPTVFQVPLNIIAHTSASIPLLY